MKKYLLFLTPLLLLLGGCNSKPSFDTSLLIGTWYASDSEYEDGIETLISMVLVFENEKDLYIEAKYNVDGDYYGQILGQGEYNVTGNTIKINIPDSQMEYNVNKNFFDTTAEYNLALKEIKKEFGENNESWNECKVISVTEEKLIIEEEGEIIEFEKFQ